jgi:hypothetical protein
MLAASITNATHSGVVSLGTAKLPSPVQPDQVPIIKGALIVTQ